MSLAVIRKIEQVRMGRRFLGIALGAATVIALSAQPAWAGSGNKARLVSCDQSDCLLVSGSRADPGMLVRVNGHPVEAKGGRDWKVLLPVQDVRAWSLPGAREITVTTTQPGTNDPVTNQVDLPIGMLGSITELAYLVIPQR